jgi:hypothetical protein
VVTIVIRLDVEVEGKTLAEVEAEVMGQLRGGVGPALGAEVAKVVDGIGVGRCRECGQPRRSRGWERRRIVGLFGVMEVKRQRADCPRCGISCYPADDALGLEAQERYTLGVAEASLWLATDSSYAKSAASMGQLLDVPISAHQVHRLAQREGELVQAAWEDLRRRVFDEGDLRALAELEASAPVKDLVIVQADGTFISDRGSGKMEAKAGIVYSRKARVSRGRMLITDKRTYAGVEEGAAFGEKLVLLAAQQGAFKAKRLWFVSDGALDLRRLGRRHFPTAIYFLDLWHLEHRIQEALGVEQADRIGGLLTQAVQGDVDGLITELTELWASSGDEMERHRLLGELITYVDANREGIHNYVRYGAQGSGAIEKTMDVAVGRRLKAKGTSWFRPGAHRLLSLRILKQDRTWNRYWQARRSRTSLLAALAA